MGKMDWVIVALKSTSLDAVPELVAPLLTPNTRVLAIMNGLIEDDLISKLASLPAGHAEEHTHPIGVPAKLHLDSCAAVYGGMALICSNRIAPGQIHHSYAGLLSGGLAAASSSHSSEMHQEALEQLWAPTKVAFKYEQSIVGGRWRKNVWNLPFNGISVAMGGITVDKIVNDPGLRRLADIVMDETIAVANADMESRLIVPSCYLDDADVSIYVYYCILYHFHLRYSYIIYPM
jgi:2-dehydropantoate 2-reductase